MIEATIGESFSWIVDKDGQLRETLGVNEDGVLIVSGPLNEEQKARWRSITNPPETK